MALTSRTASLNHADQGGRDPGGPADNAPAAALPNAIVAPVIRDHRFQHYAPDRFSVVRTASSAAERFEIRLHSLVHRETAQRLAIIPGREFLTVGRDIRIELVELAVIDLAWPQLVSLRDELTRAIAAAVPIAPDEAAERLAHLTAQIAVAEGQRSRQAWEPPEGAATPPAQALARLSDTIGMLIDRLEPSAVARLQSPDRSGKEAVSGTRGRWHMNALWGVPLLAGIIGLLAWSMAGEGRHAWSRLQPPGSGRPTPALPSRGDGLPSPTTLMAAPAEPPPEPAIPSRSDAQAPDQTGTQESPPSLGALITPAPALPSPEPNRQTDGKAEPAVTAPAPSLVTEAPPSASLSTPGAAIAEVRTAGGAGLGATENTSAVAETPMSHVAIHVTAETWVRVRDGAGRTYIERLLKAGETWPVPAIHGLVLTTGNSGSTFILVDGVSGSALGVKGVVRTEKLP